MGLLDSLVDDPNGTMKQMHNGEFEFAVLNRFPFHDARSRAASLMLYASAIRYMFDQVPKEFHLALMGRFARKLVKRMQYFDKQGV